MANGESQKSGETPRFSFCPQCGLKGLYQISQQYYRCRYCGTYLIIMADDKEPEKPA